MSRTKAQILRSEATVAAAQKIVHMVDIERKNFAQIATLTKKSVQAVGSLYCRAKLEGLA